jgi:hypothetical protein
VNETAELSGWLGEAQSSKLKAQRKFQPENSNPAGSMAIEAWPLELPLSFGL